MSSMNDFPSSLRAKKFLKYSSTPTFLNCGGVFSVIKLATGPTILSCFKPWNIAIESLSFLEFTVARAQYFDIFDLS